MNKIPTASRMIAFTDKVFKEPDGTLKEGSEYKTFYNKYGFQKIGAIFHFHNGKLHSFGDNPAVEFEDTHTEYWKNGKIHNSMTNKDGETMPAIISDYMNILEVWNNGERIK